MSQTHSDRLTVRHFLLEDSYRPAFLPVEQRRLWREQEQVSTCGRPLKRSNPTPALPFYNTHTQNRGLNNFKHTYVITHIWKHVNRHKEVLIKCQQKVHKSRCSCELTFLFTYEWASLNAKLKDMNICIYSICNIMCLTMKTAQA